jgi:hypothetical protein
MPSNEPESFQLAMRRTMEIVQQHLMHQRRSPSQLREIAARLKITETAALSLAIADHLCDEFTLTPIGG